MTHPTCVIIAIPISATKTPVFCVRVFASSQTIQAQAIKVIADFANRILHFGTPVLIAKDTVSAVVQALHHARFVKVSKQAKDLVDAEFGHVIVEQPNPDASQFFVEFVNS